MPKKAEAKIRRRARKKFPGNKRRQDAYTYGALRNMGWKPKREK